MNCTHSFLKENFKKFSIALLLVSMVACAFSQRKLQPAEKNRAESSTNSPKEGWLFPVYGLELGKSTDADIRRKTSKHFLGLDHEYLVKNHLFRCDNNGILFSVLFFDHKEHPWPKEIIRKGYNPNLSFGQWVSFLVSQGYTIDESFTVPDEYILAKRSSPIGHDVHISFKSGKADSLSFTL